MALHRKHFRERRDLAKQTSKELTGDLDVIHEESKLHGHMLNTVCSEEPTTNNLCTRALLQTEQRRLLCQIDELQGKIDAKQSALVHWQSRINKVSGSKII